MNTHWTQQYRKCHRGMMDLVSQESLRTREHITAVTAEGLTSRRSLLVRKTVSKRTSAGSWVPHQNPFTQPYTTWRSTTILKPAKPSANACYEVCNTLALTKDATELVTRMNRPIARSSLVTTKIPRISMSMTMISILRTLRMVASTLETSKKKVTRSETLPRSIISVGIPFGTVQW